MATVHAHNGFAEKLTTLGSKLNLTLAQFESLSQAAELELSRNPAGYRTKVIALALLGYAFIALVIGTLLTVTVACINFCIAHHHIYGIKLIIPMCLVLFVMFKALWVKKVLPKGIEITRSDAPELFRMIDELTDRLNTKVDKVLIDDDDNAYVVQISEFGFLGIYSNYLVLGIPLMLSLRPDQYKGILAHELGHLSGNHSRSAAWIYNLRVRWTQILDEIKTDSSLFFFVPFYLFLMWFLPRFDAYTLALARVHELEADADAVEIVGAQAFTESMIGVRVNSRIIAEKFWPAVMKESRFQIEPQRTVFSAMQKHVAEYRIDDIEFNRILAETFNDPGSGSSTHPSIRKRLTGGLFTPVLSLPADLTDIANSDEAAAICDAVRKPIAPEDSAANFYLGNFCETLLNRLNSDWHGSIAERWKGEFEYYESARKRIVEIDALSEAERQTVDVLKEKANLIHVLEDAKAARPVLRQILELKPMDPSSNYNLGISLIKDKDPEGVKLLRTAMSLQPMYTPDVCSFLIEYYDELGYQNDAQEYREKSAAFADKLALAQKERQSVDGKSALEPHTLTDDDIKYLRRIFVHLIDIDRVWAVNKHLDHLPESPYMVLGVEMFDGSINQRSDEKMAMARWLMQNLELPCGFCVSGFELSTGKLQKNIRAVSRSLIYEKGKLYEDLVDVEAAV